MYISIYLYIHICIELFFVVEAFLLEDAEVILTSHQVAIIYIYISNMCPVKNHFGGYKMIKKMVKNSRELALRRASTLPKKNWPAALGLRRLCEACAARVKSAYFSSDFARTPGLKPRVLRDPLSFCRFRILAWRNVEALRINRRHR